MDFDTQAIDIMADYLANKYSVWGEYGGLSMPDEFFSRQDWIDEVNSRDTQLGYWNWVAKKIMEERVVSFDLNKKKEKL